MADPTRPLVVVAGEADGICDPGTGLCAFPDPVTEPYTELEAVVSEPG